MTLVEGMNYRQWQKRNTEYFNRLIKPQQAESREQGYRNVGWSRVQKSWGIVNNNPIEDEKTVVPFRKTNNVVSLFERKLHKGDILGAIEQSILESERASASARQALKDLEENENYLSSRALQTLAKYPII